MLPSLHNSLLVRLSVLLILLSASAGHALPVGTATSTTLSISPGTTVAAGSVIAMTATVTDINNLPVTQGTVKFCLASATYCEGPSLLGVVQLVRLAGTYSLGTATLHLRLGAGQKSIKAVFRGTVTDATSSSAAQTLTVTGAASGGAASATSLTSSGSAGNYTLSSTVAGSVATPTGAISFLDTSNKNYSIAAATLGAGTSAPTLSPAPSSATPYQYQFVVADLNGDGIPDLIQASYPTVGFNVYLGNGNGGFSLTPASPYAVPSEVEYFAVADFNGDGIPDLVFGGNGGTEFHIFLGLGNGAFYEAPYSPIAVAQTPLDHDVILPYIGDFNGDGIPDIAFNTNNVFEGIAIYLGSASGGFTQAPGSPVSIEDDGQLSIGDFNNDGFDDISLLTSTDDLFSDQTSIAVLEGNSTGALTVSATTPANIPINGSNYFMQVTQDFNNDGNLDMAYAAGDTYDGTPPCATPSALCLVIELGDGTGHFTSAPSSPIPVRVATPGAGDQLGGGSINVGALLVASADFNGDGIADLVLVNEDAFAIPLGDQCENYPQAGLSLVLGDGTGNFTEVAGSPFPIAPNTPGCGVEAVTVADMNGDGIPDVVLSTQGNATLGNFGTYVDFGEHGSSSSATALSVTVPGGGSHAIEASYPGDSNYAASVSATASLTGTLITTATAVAAMPPSGVVAGQSITLTASLSPSSEYNYTPTGSISFLDGTTIICSAVAFNASGNANCTTPALTFGLHNFTATYSGDSNFSASTSAITAITANAPAPTITFAVANHTYGNAPFTVAATSNSSGTITYSVVSGPATISGSTVTLTGAGTVVLQASQAASGSSYSAGTQNATFTVAGGAPTITFAVANQTFGAAAFAVAATSNSTGAITYSVVSGSATLSGALLTLTGTGPVVLQASEAAAGNYAAAIQNATFTVAAAAPTITFAVANQTYGATPFAVAATSNSSGGFTYSVVSGPATISGSTVTLTEIGPIVLQSSQIAAGNYLAGTQNATFTVAAAAPTITFAVANQNYGTTPFAVAASSNSTGAITYSVVSGPATISGSTMTLTGEGTVVLQASQLAAGNYTAGTQNATFTVAGAAPTITFAVANHTYGNAPFTVSATSNSTGAITYSVISGPATVSGSTVTLTGVGTVVLQASQVAAGNYAAATQNASFTVAAVAPTITFAVANQSYGAAPFAVAATSNSTGAFTYSVVSGPATASGSTMTLTGVGTVVLQASQAAAGNYLAGTQNATFTVAAGAPTITFTVANQTYGAAPFAVAATSNSTGAITYSVVSGAATISGSTLTLTGTGSVVLQASQVAAGNYTAGTQNATFTVAPETQTITFAAPASPVNYGVAPLSLSASASSGLAVVFSVLSGPASVSGSTLTITGAGTVIVAADQPGNTTYAAAAEVTRSITVNKITPAAGLTASPNPSLVQTTVTLTATVASSVGTPTGSVVFSDTGTMLGTANLTGGIATLTTSTLAIGSHSIIAAYSGDGNFNSVSSTAVSQTVEDFTLTIGASGSSQTVQPGGTATYTLPMTPSGGTTFPAAISFSASGVPAGFTATFSPASLTAGSAATNVALVIQVPTTAMLEKSRRPGRGLPLVALSLLMLPFLGRSRRRSRQWLSLLALIVVVMAGVGGLAALTGCGGGGSGSSGESANQPQTYNIIVTATSGTLSHSTAVTLVVE